MTIAACPQGCGGYVNTAKENYCSWYRRDLSAVDLVIPEDANTENYGDSNCMTVHKANWCWAWWGPSEHRMRCRLPKGHEGGHDTHEEPSDTISVSIDGQRVR